MYVAPYTDHLGPQHELLYATSSTKPVTSFLPLESLIHTCSILSSEKFASLYPAFHPSWSTRWKITTDALSDDGESDGDDEDEDELLLNLSSEQQLDRQVQATKIPPAIALATSTSGFNAHKRAVPLVYFCRRAFDKFGKGGEGKSWWYINWESLFAKGVNDGNWSVTDDVKIYPKKTSAPKSAKGKPTPSRTSKRGAANARTEAEEVEEEASGDDTASDLEDVESVASEEIDDAASSDEDQDASQSGLPSTPSKKRKRAGSMKTKETPRKRRKNQASETATPKRSRKRNTENTTTPRKKKDRTRSTAMQTITQEIDPLLLPTDPYERALHLLHVGATPDSLPCREDEFLEVLTKVEEGIEDGGGGCLCKHISCRNASFR